MQIQNKAKIFKEFIAMSNNNEIAILNFFIDSLQTFDYNEESEYSSIKLDGMFSDLLELEDSSVFNKINNILDQILKGNTCGIVFFDQNNNILPHEECSDLLEAAAKKHKTNFLFKIEDSFEIREKLKSFRNELISYIKTGEIRNNKDEIKKNIKITSLTIKLINNKPTSFIINNNKDDEFGINQNVEAKNWNILIKLSRNNGRLTISDEPKIHDAKKFFISKTKSPILNKFNVKNKILEINNKTLISNINITIQE